MRDANTEKNRFRGRPGFLPSYFVRRDVMWEGRWGEIRNMLSASMCITSAGGSRSARERTRPPQRAQSQRSGSSHGLPPPERGEVSGQKVLEVQGGHCCLSCRLDHKGKPPSDRLAASPQAKSCLLPEKALALRVSPELAGRQAWAAALGATRDGRGVRLPSGAALPPLGASCPPSSCGGRGYRRARTRRTRSRWREQPSAGWGTGP